MIMNKEQIINEIFLSLRKRGVVRVNDVVVQGIVRSAIKNKYKNHLSIEEFQSVGNELVNKLLFNWNERKMLSITPFGIQYLEKKSD